MREARVYSHAQLRLHIEAKIFKEILENLRNSQALHCNVVSGGPYYWWNDHTLKMQIER